MSTCFAGFAGGLHDQVANLIMAAPSVGWVDLSVINGEIVVKDGVLQTLDLQVYPHIQGSHDHASHARNNPPYKCFFRIEGLNVYCNVSLQELD